MLKNLYQPEIKRPILQIIEKASPVRSFPYLTG